MRYVYCGNNRPGVAVLRWLVEQGDRPAGIVLHPAGQGAQRDAWRRELIELSGTPPKDRLEATEINTPCGHAWMRAHRPDWLVSVYFGYLFKPAVLAIPAKAAINLHPALLPHNRGSYPNVWSIVKGTPAGVTLHLIDAGVDTGDIVAQRPVEVRPGDTGASLYARLGDAAIELFKEMWPAICAGTFNRTPQPSGGSLHRLRDVEQLDRLDPDRQMRVQDLIDLIRARTFPPYQGAYLDLEDRRVYLRLELTEEPK